MALTDTQLVQLINQLLQDNTSEDITPEEVRQVLLELVRAKINASQLEGFAQLASPTFSGVPLVPTAPAGTATNQVASTGFVAQALALLAGSRNLSELVVPQAVLAGNWYLTLGGIWEPRRNFTASADPASGPNWRQVASFTGPAVTITADAILDVTPAGKRLVTAASAAAQRALLGNPSIVAGQYGDHPGWMAEDGPDGLFAWVIKSLLAVKAVKQPDAPTNGRVNDVNKEFSFTVNPAYPSYLQYLVGGLPGSIGPVALSPANAYQVGDTAFVKVGAGVTKGNLGVYVAGSGNVPNGKVLVNDEAFTGTATTTPPATTTPDPPTVVFDAASRILSASHPSYDTGELEYRRSQGTVLAYAAVGVDDSAHQTAEWQYRVKAATGRTVSQWADSPSIAAKATTPTPTALAVAFSIGSNTATAGDTLSFSGTASGGTAPYQHLVQATDAGSGQVTTLGSYQGLTYAGSWANLPQGTYELTDTVTDAAGTSKISASRRLVVSPASTGTNYISPDYITSDYIN